MKKVLLVDLDDTLLSFKKASEMSLKVIFKMHNIPFTKVNREKYHVINQNYWHKYELKEISREVILERRFKDFFKEFDIQTDGKIENEIYFRGLKEKVYFMPNAKDFLQKTKDLGLKIYLVSNGVGEVQSPRLKKSGINKFLDGIYISEIVGYAKPNIEFFNPVLKEINTPKEDIVIVGDSLTSDIQGGKNVGITTVWYNHENEESTLPDYQINNLMEFFSLDIMK